MIDDIRIVIVLDSAVDLFRKGPKESFIYNDIVFHPKYDPKTGYVQYYHTKIDNLWLKVSEGELTINNSWHKYYKGNNYEDYTLSEIMLTYERLSKKLNFDIINAKLVRIAYGLVINTKPDINYNNWKLFRTTLPSPMKKNTKTYGMKFVMTDYSIKGYDKTAEVWMHNKKKIEDNYFRVEVEVKNMKHLRKRKHQINIYSLGDVLKYENMQLLMSDLLKKYDVIEKELFYDYSILDKKQRSILSMMKDLPFRDYLRIKENKTYKRYKKKIKEIEMKSVQDIHYETKYLLTQKVIELLNS